MRIRVVLCAVALSSAFGSGIAAAAPAGQITEFSSGLNAGGIPAQIAPGPDGNMWFTDQGDKPAIGRISPDGQITEFSGGLSPARAPIWVTPGADGNLWFGEGGLTSGIGRITPNGLLSTSA